MSNIPHKTKVAIVDDHKLLRGALANLVNSFEKFEVLFEADNGLVFKERLQDVGKPDVVLLDVNMPDMDGYATVKWITTAYPEIRVLALSMLSDETTIIKMIRNGSNGYLMKSAEPEELLVALESVMKRNFYLSEETYGKVIVGLQKHEDEERQKPSFTGKELEYLQLLCSDLSNKEIAAKLFISPRTLDDYRNALFKKTGVTSRVGLAVYAIKNGLVEI
ncbi:MAG: response regulator transcription factor [Hydrotalea sp.]|jgi:DNA-binding NarL/FixJ family response regulator|nr:response regulator transcription factor [Hydrotalea sp.]